MSHHLRLPKLVLPGSFVMRMIEEIVVGSGMPLGRRGRSVLPRVIA